MPADRVERATEHEDQHHEAQRDDERPPRPPGHDVRQQSDDRADEQRRGDGQEPTQQSVGEQDDERERLEGPGVADQETEGPEPHQLASRRFSSAATSKSMTGQVGSMSVSASSSSCCTAYRAYHFLSAGTTYQGAPFVAVRVSATW